MTMCRSASPLLPYRGELKKKGGGRLALLQVTHILKYQQADEIAPRTHTPEVMEVDALASAAGNGGAKREREEEDIGEGFTV